jgi:hypothetical protein
LSDVGDVNFEDIQAAKKARAERARLLIRPYEAPQLEQQTGSAPARAGVIVAAIVAQPHLLRASWVGDSVDCRVGNIFWK